MSFKTDFSKTCYPKNGGKAETDKNPAKSAKMTNCDHGDQSITGVMESLNVVFING